MTGEAPPRPDGRTTSAGCLPRQVREHRLARRTATVWYAARAITKLAPTAVASTLERPERSLTTTANSLAEHFADWGAVSRFSTNNPAPATTALEEHQMQFDDDIKSLFREQDRAAMRFAFDLWSHEDVATNASAILGRLEAGTMPCDGPWPDERVAVFRQWIDDGTPG